MKNLMRTVIVASTAAVALTLSGCGSLGEMAKDWEASASEAKLRYDIRHEQAVKSGETIRLVLDLEVSDLVIETVSGKEIQFTQKANKEKLLAQMTVKSMGGGQEVVFKTPTKLSFNAGSQSASATLGLPRGVNYIIESRVAVGSVEMQETDLEIKSADFSVDVGDIKWSSSGEQLSLESIVCQVDVGNVELLIGEAPKLDRLAGTVNVGNLEIIMEKHFKQDLDLKGKADVGDIKITLPKTQRAQLSCDVPEYVGDLDIKGLEYSEKSGEYQIEGSDAYGILRGELSVGTGNMTLEGK